MVSRLCKRLEAPLAPDTVLPTVVETIAQALKLPYAAILLKEDEGYGTAASYGSPRGEPETLPLVYQRAYVSASDFTRWHHDRGGKVGYLNLMGSGRRRMK